jgi:hypothetical protein
VNKKERTIEEDRDKILPRTLSIDLLPPSPKVPRTFQNSATNWGPGIEHMSMWGPFYIQTINFCDDPQSLIAIS